MNVRGVTGLTISTGVDGQAGDVGAVSVELHSLGGALADDTAGMVLVGDDGGRGNSASNEQADEGSSGPHCVGGWLVSKKLVSECKYIGKNVW